MQLNLLSGPVRWQLFLRYRNLPTEAGDHRALFSTISSDHADAQKVALCCCILYRLCNGHNVLPRHLLVRVPSVCQLVARRGSLQHVQLESCLPGGLGYERLDRRPK